MGCCCQKQGQKGKNNIPIQQVPIIVNNQEKQLDIIIPNPPVHLPDSPLIKKQIKKKLDIREINLLESQIMDQLQSRTSEISNQSEIKKFEELIQILEKESTQFANKKGSIETQLTQSFIQDESNLQNYSYNQDFIGVKVTNKNICDIENKYDFSQIKQFTEYQGRITIVRLIQKQKSTICTYIGKIDQKYCCVKLIPMAKRIDIDKWINRVQIAQLSNDDHRFDISFQFYYYYKIETIMDEPQYCNCFIISSLEQYNVYTFSRHPSVTISEKAQVAFDIIPIIQGALNSNQELNSNQSDSEKVSELIFKRMKTVKRNNILISRLQNQERKLKILLSDWQLLLPEFEQIIPNKQLQEEDQLIEIMKTKISQINESVYNNLQEEASLTELVPKYFLKLLFFKLNFELLNDVNLDGFINEAEFQSKCEILRQFENDVEKVLQQNIEYQIKEGISIQNEPNQIKFMNKKSQQMCNLFQLNPDQNRKTIYEIYLIINKLKCEGMRSHFRDYNQTISNQNNVNQQNQ
ncbi:unnamed protein product [Paramecium pentaurelia]|uniref:Uncharacterized protein n=1 Tax=Paramecium pentaurelia TaxID=43138 RepID=A0A8S1XVK0_9CILI|nr:unnamed protein product [Paramecium pentaurelia]